MEWIARLIAKIVRAAQRAYERKWVFLPIFAFVFFALVALLGRLGLLPAAEAARTPTASSAQAPTAPVAEHGEPVFSEAPRLIRVPAIGLSATIANPDTTSIPALDALLLKGAVRYPTSALPGAAGNVILFGHSSYLPIVYNPAYKTFNDIQKLARNDRITLYSSHFAYVYRVKSVRRESAGDGVIPLTVSAPTLTLATCDSFGAKTDRFVVTADFVESHPISG